MFEKEISININGDDSVLDDSTLLERITDLVLHANEKGVDVTLDIRTNLLSPKVTIDPPQNAVLENLTPLNEQDSPTKGQVDKMIPAGITYAERCCKDQPGRPVEGM